MNKIIEEIRTIDNNVATILSRLFWTSEMQSLIRLWNCKNSSSYFSSTPLMSIWDQQKELFIEHLNLVKIRFSNWIEGWRWSDLKIISGLLNNMEELRSLFINWLLTTDSVRDLYAIMFQNWKVSIKDLKPEDEVIFWLNNFQMNTFIWLWSPVFSFSDIINKQIHWLIQ